MTSASRALLDDVASRVHIDRTRVYATGISNGGMMAFRLGVEASDRIAGDRPRGGRVTVDISGLARPMPLMLFNSVDDCYVPYEGRFGRLGRIADVTPFPPVDEEIARMAQVRWMPGQRAGRTDAEGCAGHAGRRKFRDALRMGSLRGLEAESCCGSSQGRAMYGRARHMSCRGSVAARRSSTPTIRCGSSSAEPLGGATRVRTGGFIERLAGPYDTARQGLLS